MTREVFTFFTFAVSILTRTLTMERGTMSIRRNDDIGRRGPKDAKRHRDKQKDAIKKQLPDIIAEESIITERKGKKIKIPIRRLDIPTFRPGNRRKGEDGDGENGGGSAGIGQGPGKPGDIIGRRGAKGKKPGQAGEEPGEDYIETEVDIEEIIEMAMEDMGLPNIKQKTLAEIEVSLGFKVSGLRRTGPRQLLHTKKTIKEGLKTFWKALELLKTETGLDEKICFWALQESNGILDDALELLKQDDLKIPNELPNEIIPFPVFDPKKMRYRSLKEEKEKESNAVVFVMLDVSGSMGIQKKYIARSMMFWLVGFLRKLYENVEIRFIIYHTEARTVDEYTAFHTVESGGTKAVSAYELAQRLIEIEYDTNRWNVYAFHFSDGDDFEPERAVEAAAKLVEQFKINMLGYVEIDTNDWNSSNLMPGFIERMNLDVGDSDNTEIYVGDKNYPFVGAVIESKEHIWPVIKQLLRKDRWQA